MSATFILSLKEVVGWWGVGREGGGRSKTEGRLNHPLKVKCVTVASVEYSAHRGDLC